MSEISCTECRVFTCHTREELRGHLEGEHGIKIETKELEFDSMEQFLQWKKKMEGDENVIFSKRSSEVMMNSEKSRLYYSCNYSQTAMQCSLGKTLYASLKMVCPASLIVSKMPSSKISVTFYKTHTGHTVSMGSHNRTYADKAMAAVHIVPATNGTDGFTVEVDSSALWEQDLLHGSNGPVIVAVEQSYDTSWQQELQHSSLVPISVTVDQTDTVPQQEQLQYSTPVPGSVTVEKNDALPCQQELQHSTPDICGTMDYNEGLCEISGVSVGCRKALYKHLRECHDKELNLNEYTEKCHMSEKTFSSVPSVSYNKKMHMPPPEKVKGSCMECERTFSSVAALKYHMKMHAKAHQKMSCTECGVFMCCTREELRGHLESEHGINMETKELEFDSMEQFLQWKRKMEGDEKVFFTKLSSEQMVNSGSSRLYYTCHHSRTTMEHSVGKRLRGPPKTNKTCPASLTVSKLSPRKINVKFYATHTGHNLTSESFQSVHTDRTGHTLTGPNSTDGSTVEEGSATPLQCELQHVPPELNTKHCVVVEHDYAM